MGDLSERDVEDVLGGVQPPGRDDLAPVVELTTWLHVSREIEPPPAMRDDLFCQIEDGLRVYQRSSRRAPAHLRHRGSGTRPVRETLAGSRRPIVSVAAAAVLLMGVILAVRAGGPSREPSAFVSPAAQGVPSTAADTTTTTTTAPTTTSPPTSASDAGPTAGDSEQSTTTEGTTESPPPTDAQTGSRSHDDDQAPPTTQERSDERRADGTSDSGEHRPRRGTEPRSDVTDDAEQWNLPLSGWDFDLSEWSAAKALWEALQAGERGEPSDLRDDPGGESDDERHHDGDDEDRNHRRSDVGHGERDGDEDGVTERPDADDAEQESGLSD
jgi:hypothetical protein